MCAFGNLLQNLFHLATEKNMEKCEKRAANKTQCALTQPTTTCDNNNNNNNIIITSVFRLRFGST